ncbi:ABC transporter permease [Methylovirgula sp. 4M-Z18]|uniref:ABC transporter permease n=1 Tax=Methylovirgula sp. 4M-Z18 TaxID=2293567 RepID=UPI0030D452BF
MASLPVDWQVLVAPGADPAMVVDAIGKAARYASLQSVGYADTDGFGATTGETSQTTGPGKVLGLEADYRRIFSGQLELNVGSWDGVLAAAQTAANLHVAPGDIVTIRRVGMEPVDVRIAGVVALPNADSMFQAIGVSKSLAPQAPPDNVLLMPMQQWRAIFDPQSFVRPDTVRTEIHVLLERSTLPPDPSTAFILAQRTANSFEARVAGSAALTNNLVAQLDAVRADALYARVLFLFLGIPGVILALLVTLAIVASGSERRRREQALLRLRGASRLQVLQLAGIEAVTIGSLGVATGLILAVVITIGWWRLEDLRLAMPWLIAVGAIGFGFGIAASLIPAWMDATRTSISAARAEVDRQTSWLWQRLYADIVILAMGAIVFWTVARSGYEIVLAPEGVAQTSVHYEAFLAPLCLWIGAHLLWLRLSRWAMRPRHSLVTVLLAPFSAQLAPIIAASLSRQRRRMAKGVALVALAFAFATATAIFNSTYNAQARVDAELANGADVTLTGTTSHPADALLAELSTIPGVDDVEPMMHRFAYVGADLQDIFGIDPLTIGKSTTISNAYFANHDAAKSLSLLAETPDGVFVSQETVDDFQLQQGDRLNLRLQSTGDQQYHVVPFKFIGIVREFPTAPKDSFLVANADYIAKQTGSDAREVVMLRTSGDTDTVAAAARSRAATQGGAKVSTLGETQALISSSLTAVDLRGLTALELAYSVLMIAGVTGIVLALGLAERRRSFTILSALGATPRQLGAFLWGEGLFIVIGGAILGTPVGCSMAYALVTLLAGVFDPPPETLSVPWLYLTVALATALVCGSIAIAGTLALSKKPDLEALRGG